MADRIRIDVVAATEEAVKGIKNVSVQVQSLDKNADKASQGVKKTNDALKDTEKQSKKSETGLKGIVKTIGSIGIAAAGITAALAAAKKAFDFTREGAAIHQTKTAFDSLTGSIGGNTGALKEWREASNGTITDLDLMSGYQTVAAGTSKELSKAFFDNNARLLEISKAASALNPQLGDTAFMYDSITRGIKRSSPLILDNLGLVIKTGEANEEYAKQLGKTVAQLTAEEKTMALLNAALKSGDRLIGQLGGTVDAATDPWDKLTTAIKNSTNGLKENISQNKLIGTTINWVADQMNTKTRAQEALRDALKRGAITQKEYNKTIRQAGSHTIEWSDALEWAESQEVTFEDQLRSTMNAANWYRDVMDRATKSTNSFGTASDVALATATDKYKAMLGMMGNFADTQDDINEKQDDLRELLKLQGDQGAGYFEGQWLSADALKNKIIETQDEIGTLKGDMKSFANQTVIDMAMAHAGIDGIITPQEFQQVQDLSFALGEMSRDAANAAITEFNRAFMVWDAMNFPDKYTTVHVNVAGGSVEYGGSNVGILGPIPAPSPTTPPKSSRIIQKPGKKQTQALGGLYQTSTPTLFQSSEMNQPETAAFVPQGKTIWDVAPAEQVYNLLGGRGGGGNVGGGKVENHYHFNVPSTADAIRTYEQLKVLT